MGACRLPSVLLLAVVLASACDGGSTGGGAPDATADARGTEVLADIPRPADGVPDTSPLTGTDVADGTDAASGPRTLGLMTFNLRTAFGGDGENGWESRRDLVASVVRDAAPDVLATQEGWRFQVDDLATRLPDYRWAGESRRGNGLDEYCAVFWRADRLALEATGTFWLSPTPDVVGSLFSDAQCCPRIVTWVRLRPVDGGAAFWVFATHFDTTNEDAVSERSAALLARSVRTLAGSAPVFALGDFNAAPGAAAWRILTGAETYGGETGGLVDAWSALGLAETGTFHGFTGAATSARIDWILAGPGATPTAAAVVTTSDAGRYPSDHFPVTATFALAPRPDEGIAPDVDPAALPLPPETAPPVALPDGVTVRAGSYNVYSAKRGTPEAIGAALRALDLDLVGLEECAADLGATIAAAADYPYVAGDGDVLLSRTPLEDVAALPLGDGRTVTHATTVIDGVRFSVYVAHTSWQVAGLVQCRRLVDEVLAADPVPHLVMVGDFNDEHLSPQDAVLDEVLEDAFTALGWYPGERISWPSTGFDETEGSQLIDLVWFRRGFPALVVAGEVVDLTPPLSDHKPTWAELLFPRDPSTPFATDPLATARDRWRELPAEGARPANLLVNPGAEAGSDGWTVAGGATSVAARGQVRPRSGAAFFTGFETPEDPAAPWSSGTQTVDLTAHAEAIDAGRGFVDAAGWVRTDYAVEERDGLVANIPKAYDDGELLVEALDAGGTVLERRASGRRDPLQWDPWAAALPLPPGARAARLTWLTHRKFLNGMANDTAFDDLYLAYEERPRPHAVLTGNRLVDPGAETRTLEAWTADPAWHAQTDLAAAGPWGFEPFPPGSSSGTGFFYAGAEILTATAPPGTAELAQVVDLEPLRDLVEAGDVAVRWGGRLRTYRGLVAGHLRLAVLDADGSVWHAYDGAPVRAAAWTSAEARTRIPKGAKALRFSVIATLDRTDDGLFADDLSLRLERAP